jgi:hypothetical protein
VEIGSDYSREITDIILVLQCNRSIAIGSNMATSIVLKGRESLPHVQTIFHKFSTKHSNNFGGLVNNSHGKYRNPIVKNAMNALQKDNAALAKESSKDINSAMCTEKLSPKLAQTEDLEAFKERMDHIHVANISEVAHHQQRSSKRHISDDQQEHEANVSKARHSTGECKSCGRNVVHSDCVCGAYNVNANMASVTTAMIVSRRRIETVRIFFISIYE